MTKKKKKKKKKNKKKYTLIITDQFLKSAQFLFKNVKPDNVLESP